MPTQAKATSTTLTPAKSLLQIFSEILVIPFPQGFVGASARTHNDFYINEMVLKGETIDHWSQMITQTGREGLSSNPNVSPEGYLNAMAGGFKRHCPDTFSARGMGATTVSGHNGFVAWASCGTLNSDGYAHSESTLFSASRARRITTRFSGPNAVRLPISHSPMTMPSGVRD